MRSTEPSFIHIAAGCLRNARGEVLICQRPAHKIYPGEWEFPGGKVEPGETAEAALRRELHEELGVTVREYRRLIRLRHVYPELAVDLDTWLVSGFDGTVRTAEHPAVAWVRPEDLPEWPLLAADRPIVNALRLPAHYIFTPPGLNPSEVMPSAAHQLPPGLLRLRLPALSDEDYREWVHEIAPVILETGHQLIVDRDAADVARFDADGFHATSVALRQLRERPVAANKWFGASCHSAGELTRARSLGADYAVLGPVLATPTHPDAQPLGWSGFQRLALQAGLPVYAIGGVGPDDLAVAWANGAQGVAGISAYWGFRRSGGSSASGGADGIV